MSETPTAARQPRTLLKAARHRLELTQQETADALAAIAFQAEGIGVGVNADMVSKWERGAKGISEEYCRWLCILFDEPRERLELSPAREVDLSNLLGGDAEVDRRKLMSLPVMGIGLAATQPWEQLAHALRRTMTLDEVVVDQVEAATSDLHHREEFTPAKNLHGEAVAHLEQLTALLGGSGQSPLRKRVASTAGEAAALAGWLAFDLGDEHEARSFYRVALEAAREANDPPLHACILGYLSYMASSAGHPQRALGHLRQAMEYARAEVPLTTAWLAGRAAEESALLGDATEASRYIGLARETYEEFPGRGIERSWVQFFDRSRLLSLAIATYAKLNRQDDVEQAATELLSVQAGDAKKHAIAFADLAVAHAEAGSMEAATGFAQQSLTLTVEHQCRWALDRLRRFRTTLAESGSTDQNGHVIEELDEVLVKGLSSVG